MSPIVPLKTSGVLDLVENFGALEEGGEEEICSRQKAVLRTKDFIKAISESQVFKGEYSIRQYCLP